MEQSKKLYPLSFTIIESDKENIREEILLSDMDGNSSFVKSGWLKNNSLCDIMDVYPDKIVSEDVYKFYGRQFPVSVKRLITDGFYGLWACPDDLTAGARYESLGKKKFWYILEASESSKIYIGLNRNVSVSELYDSSVSGDMLKFLSVVHPEKGDYFEICPGEIHGAEGKLKILEISESSELDFNIFSIEGRSERSEEDMISAIDFISFLKTGEIEESASCGCHGDSCGCHEHHDGCSCEDEPRLHSSHDGKIISELVSGEEFEVNKVNLSEPLHIYTEKFRSFLLYYCVEGKVEFEFEFGQEITKDMPKSKSSYELREGELVLIPYDCGDFIISPLPHSVLLEVNMPERKIMDLYTEELEDGGEIG